MDTRNTDLPGSESSNDASLTDVILDALLFAGAASRVAVFFCLAGGKVQTAVQKGYGSSQEIGPIVDSLREQLPALEASGTGYLVRDIVDDPASRDTRPAALIRIGNDETIGAVVHLDRQPGARAFDPDQIAALQAHIKALSQCLRREGAAAREPFEREVLSENQFRSELVREIKRASRYLKSCTILALDHVPASPQHPIPGPTPELIRALGSAYSSLIRDIDLLGNPAGFRFDVLLPDTGRDGASKVAQRILQASEDRTSSPRVERPLPVVIGIASYPDDALGAESLYARALTALEQARQRGPLTVHGTGETEPVNLRSKRSATNRVMAPEFFRISQEGMTALEMTDRLLKSGLPADRVPETIIALGAMGINARRGCLAVYDAGGRLAITSYYHADRRSDVRFSPPEQMLKRALGMGRPVAERLRTNGSPDLIGLSVCAPVTFESKAIGVLYFENIEGEELNEKSHVNFLEIFAKKIAPTVNALFMSAQGNTAPDDNAGNLPTEYKYTYENIIGRSKPMQRLYEILDKVVETDHSVIIQGESGTGKELVAHAIHFNGKRKERPFIAENCAALSDNLLEAELFGYVKGAFTGADQDRKGFIEVANGGTLFLDEIGEMNVKMQKDMLRVLQEGEIRPVGGKRFIKVDVRIICASNRDLKKLVKEGTFREDLFYRLNVVTIDLPSLRDRVDDIPPLFEHFLELIAKETNQSLKRFTPRLVEALMRYDWPGNIRELKNESKRMIAMSKNEVLDVEDFQYADRLPVFSPTAAGTDIELITLDEMERRHILRVIEATRGNKMKAADLLGINRATIFRKLKKYDLE